MPYQIGRSKPFWAEDDDGNRYRLEHIGGPMAAPALGANRQAWTVAGSADLQLSDGTPVQRLERGRYEIVGSAIVLTSTDPDAV